MSTTEQKALELAEAYAQANATFHLESLYGTSKTYTAEKQREALEAQDELFAELRRLSAENEALRAQVEALTATMRQIADAQEENEYHAVCNFETLQGMAKSALIGHPIPSPLTRPAVPEEFLQEWAKIKPEQNWNHHAPDSLDCAACGMSSFDLRPEEFKHEPWCPAEFARKVLAAAPQPPVEVFSSDDLVLVPCGLLGSACAVMCRAGVPHTETLAALRRYTVGDLSAAAPQPEKWDSNLLGEIVGCFDAAFTEGLHEALAESKDTRLVNLVNRRLMHAYYAAIGPSKPESQPTVITKTLGRDGILGKAGDVVTAAFPALADDEAQPTEAAQKGGV